ncbi:MAG: M14 family metallopeptidase, partial [Sphingomonas bacterium]
MKKLLLGVSAAAFAFTAASARPQAARPENPAITTPRAALGHDIGEDYFLASYAQLVPYWQKLATESDRAKLVDIGATAEGRREYMMIVSSPENMKQLDRYRDIAHRLAKAEGLTAEQAHALAAEGKAVVWIDGGMHANEVEHAQALMAAVYHALADDDPEWKRILNDVIILFAHDNPDGQDLNANWYMREADPKKRAIGMTPQGMPPTGITPRLFQKYIGHDNNRDFYMVNMPETENINRVLFRQWYPQIIYNHHQPGPTGAVVFMPPFRDPFNYNYDPLIITQLEEVGAAMHSRLVGEDKPGSTMRSGANYSTWFNGSLRTISYFHNTIGLLTEIIGNPTPVQLPLVPANQLPHNDLPDPVAPQTWHLSQSIEYSLSINRAVLDYASRNRERLLFNIYKMGADAIQRGSQDSWTSTPSRINALEEAAKNSGKPAGQDDFARAVGNGRMPVDPSLYEKVLHDPAKRDARGYIITADQPDFPTAVKFVNALIKNGVDVERATAPFTVAGKSYPAGSFVVKTAQAYRPHVLDMFEPQDHPQDFEYPGGPPIRPYDSTGYTLAFQMGVRFDRVLDGFDGPFSKVADVVAPPPGHVIGDGKAGWLVSHATNNSFILTNRLIKAKAPVAWIKDKTSVGGHDLAPGALWIPRSDAAAAIVAKAAAELGIDAYAVAEKPAGAAMQLKPVRIGLVDVYGGSMTSGWVRWLYEQFEFPFTLVYPQRLDAGHLERDFDVLVMTDGVYSSPLRKPLFRTGQPKPEEIPAQYRSWLGEVTADKTAPQLDAFVKAGGTLMTVGSSNYLAQPLGLPVKDMLATTGKDGKPAIVPSTQFYIPGSLLRADVDASDPLAYGMPATVDVFYDNSPAFVPADGASGVRRVSWYGSATPLASGWAWGQARLKDVSAVLDVSHGKGHVFMLMPEVTQRGQSHA